MLKNPIQTYKIREAKNTFFGSKITFSIGRELLDAERNVIFIQAEVIHTGTLIY